MTGQFNLDLFSQLFWVTVASFLVIVFSLWPISQLLRGRYLLHDATKGRACLLDGNHNFIEEFSQKGEREEDGYRPEGKKFNIFNIFFPLFIVFYLLWQRFQASRFVSGMCPLGRMSCIGAYSTTPQ